MGTNHKETQGKQLTYVTVYNKLYSMLTDGITFPVGSRLPSEPKLAVMLGVSRMTLRQALALLHEDGLLRKVQGKGNFVIDCTKPHLSGLERLGHPVYKACRLAIDEVEMEFRIEVSSKLVQQMFKRPAAVVIAMDRWYRHQEKIAAFTFSFIPVETITKMGIDLNSKDMLLEMIERGVYEYAARSHMVVQSTLVGGFISDKYLVSKDKSLILITENLYADDDYAPLVCNKHYLIPDDCSIEITAVK